MALRVCTLSPTHTHTRSRLLFICVDSETINVPMIPLGLKETKEVDFTLPVQVNQLCQC